MGEREFFDGEGRFLDLYSLLGVSCKSAPEKIKKAIRNARLLTHPDVTPEDREWAQGHHRKVNLADEVLMDEGRRRQYDELYERHVVKAKEAERDVHPAGRKPEKKAPLRIRTSPVEGAIYLDGELVARGTFTGKRLPFARYRVAFGEVAGYRTPAHAELSLPSEGLDTVFTYEPREPAGPPPPAPRREPFRLPGLAALCAIVILAVFLLVSMARRDNAPERALTPGAPRVSPGDVLDAQRERLRSSNGEYYLQRGREAFEGGDYRECLRNMHQAIAIEPGRAESHYYMFSSFARLGMTERARGAAERVLQLAPLSPAADEARRYLDESSRR